MDKNAILPLDTATDLTAGWTDGSTYTITGTYQANPPQLTVTSAEAETPEETAAPGEESDAGGEGGMMGGSEKMPAGVSKLISKAGE